MHTYTNTCCKLETMSREEMDSPGKKHCWKMRHWKVSNNRNLRKISQQTQNNKNGGMQGMKYLHLDQHDWTWAADPVPLDTSRQSSHRSHSWGRRCPVNEKHAIKHSHTKWEKYTTAYIHHNIHPSQRLHVTTFTRHNIHTYHNIRTPKHPQTTTRSHIIYQQTRAHTSMPPKRDRLTLDFAVKNTSPLAEKYLKTRTFMPFLSQ